MDIDNLKINDKVLIVYGENTELFKGYVSEITQDHLIIHEYITDIYRTFSKCNIIEISKV